MKTLAAILVLFLAGILFCGCDSSYGDKFVRHDIAAFHDGYNDEKYAELFAAGDEVMHQQGSEAQFTNFLASIHQQLGKVVSSQNESWDTRISQNRREIMLIQKTKFERGMGKETFAFVLVNGKAVLLGYHVKVDDTPAVAP